jgi:hypothetical protein
MSSDGTDIEEAGGGERTFSRRTLIKGGAIVGGTLWVAPVVESFTSKAWAASINHYCCACYSPVAGGDFANQGVADGHPNTVLACVEFCNGSLLTVQSEKFNNFAWTGPRPVPLTYSAIGLGTPKQPPGCYLGSGSEPVANCDIGTITYSGGVFSGYTVTSTTGTCIHA